MENTNPQSFKDIKVFAAGPYNHPVSDTTYRNLIWETEGKNINTWYLSSNGSFMNVKKIQIARTCHSLVKITSGSTRSVEACRNKEHHVYYHIVYIYILVVCQAGWSEFDGECYKYFSQEKTWDDAEAQCVTEEV